MTEPAPTRTGVIGLGAMGLQMARHMVAKGFSVAGTDIDPEAMRRAAAHGVHLCASAAEVGERAEVVVVMVATDAQVDDIVRTSGLLDRLRPGAVICIASSVAPQTCRDLATLAGARGIGVLDTPVVLGQKAADDRRTDHLCRRRSTFRCAGVACAVRVRTQDHPCRRGRQRPDRQDHE